MCFFRQVAEFGTFVMALLVLTMPVRAEGQVIDAMSVWEAEAHAYRTGENLGTIVRDVRRDLGSLDSLPVEDVAESLAQTPLAGECTRLVGNDETELGPHELR